MQSSSNRMRVAMLMAAALGVSGAMTEAAQSERTLGGWMERNAPRRERRGKGKQPRIERTPGAKALRAYAKRYASIPTKRSARDDRKAGRFA